MSSYYDDASLMLLASGGAGKDGKVYSVKPTDGAGDFTFTRGSNLSATRVNASQLIEKGRENLLKQSNNFDTTWAKPTTSVTSGQSGYDSSSDAWLLSATAAYARMTQSISTSGVNTFSLYAKANTTNFLLLRCNIGGNQYAIFDLSDGSNPTLYAGFISGNATSVGNGWYRILLLFNGSLSEVAIGVSTDGTIAGWDDTTNESIYIQNSQLEQGLAATPYIETGASTAQAGILENTPRFDYSGGATCPSLLLEPSRTNLVTQSEYFAASSWTNNEGTTLTANAIVSPEGVQNAFKLIPDATNAHHRIFTLGSITAGNPYTYSVFAKKGEYRYMLLRENGLGSAGQDNIGVDLETGTITYASSNYTSYDIEDYGNGWYRISASANAALSSYTIGVRFQNYETTNNGISTFTGNGTSGGYVYGFQVESGSYPTSYIPTYGVSQTRAQEIGDGVTIDTNANHTLLYDFTGTTARETSSALFNIGYDNSNRYFIKGISTNNPLFQVAGVGVFSGAINLANNVSGRNKIAVQWINGTGYVYCNGVKQSGSLSNSSSANDIDYYKFEGRGYSQNTHQLLIFNTTLSNLDCEILTGATTYNTFAEMALALNYTVYE